MTMAGVTSIGKADGEGVVSLGTQAWNIADGFTKIKILRLLIEIDLYETLAMYGKRDMEEQIDYSLIPQRRYEAIDRVVFILRQLIGNCMFSIEHGSDEKVVNGLLVRVQNVENVLDGCADWSRNDVTKEDLLVINEQHFRKCLNILRSIKDELNFPLNRASLIFKQSDEMDLDKIMQDIVEGG
jgi:hypothetical protein